MGQALPIDLLVEINSTGVRDTFTIGKLPTLLITKAKSELPQPQFSKFTNLAAVKTAFKSGSVVDFATEYFGFTSKNATKADLLNVFVINDSAQAAMIKGAKLGELGKLTGLNGSVNFTIDGKSHDIALDFTSATSYADCAAAIKTALNAQKDAGFKAAECEYNALTGGFIVKSGTSGSTSTIALVTAPTTAGATDISANLGLSKSEGGEVIAGQDIVGLDSALSLIEGNNGNYFVITFDYTFKDLDKDLATFGKWLNASAGRFMGVYSDAALMTADLTDIQANDGLLLDYKVAENQNGVVCAYISSLDLSKANSNVNLAFNDMSAYASNAITDRTTYEKMQAQMLNAPSKFGILGQDDTIYMDGTICGTLTNSANVYFCNSFIKFNEQISLYNMLKSSKIIGLRDIQSRNAINGYITEVFENAVSAKMIATGAELTTTEESVLSQTYAGLVDDLDAVYSQIEKFGYFFAITDINTTKREMSITQAYMANAPLKKLVIANYILGA